MQIIVDDSQPCPHCGVSQFSLIDNGNDDFVVATGCSNPACSSVQVVNVQRSVAPTTSLRTFIQFSGWNSPPPPPGGP